MPPFISSFLANFGETSIDRRHLGFDLKALGVAAAVAVGLFILMAALNARDPVIVEDLLLDRAEWEGKPFYLGAISQFGILAWAAGGAVAIFAAWQGWSRGDSRPDVSLLLFAGLLTACLCVDDLLQIHEVVGPRYINIGQKAFYLFYALSAAALAFTFWRCFLERPILPLMAGAAFFTSIVVDLEYLAFVLGTGILEIMLEEGLKFFGILLWSAYLISTAAWVGRDPEPV